MAAIGSFLIILAMNMEKGLQEGADWVGLLLESVKSLNLVDLVLFFVVVHFLTYAGELYRKECRGRLKKICCWIPASLFSAFMVLGYSFYMDNSWNLVFGNTLQMVKSAIALAGYFCLFSAGIVCLFHYMDRKSIKAEESGTWSGIPGKYCSCLKKYPFWTAFFTLFLLYLPYMIYSYPGIFSTDTKIQLENGYYALAGGDVHLKNHHPVVHTLLLRFCTWVGEEFFGSVNVGIFLVSLAQSILLFAVIAWCVRLLVEKQVSEKVICLILGFYVISPRIRNYIFLLVKDAWFAAFVLLFLVQLYRVLTDMQESSRERIRDRSLLAAAMLGIFFFRQDGVYVLLLTWLMILIVCKNRRRMSFGILAAVLIGSNLYTNVLLPACQVSPSNIREMFSIPFQQTARYIRDAGEDVTDEEREAIAAILDYDSLAERYNPNLSDPVKATYNKEAGREELAEYFRVWFQMMWKHPDIYVQATMNNLYGYFYPDGYTTKLYSYENSAEHMEDMNVTLEPFGTDFAYPEKWNSVRNRAETFREQIFQLPVLSALNLSAFYIWILILWFFYAFGHRQKHALLLVWPLLIILLICMAGPAYGWYFRYMYSIAVCLPVVIALGWAER